VIERFRLDGKVAVVVGATKNIGLEISRAFAEAGATVVMVARTAAALHQRRDEIAGQTGARVLTFTCDTTSGDDIDALVAGVHGEFSQIDVLVNNAYASGNTFGVPVFEIEDRAWEETFHANVLGPYRLCRGFGRRMLAGRGGSIVNVLSGSGFLPTPQVMPYGSTKSALWMMTRYLAAEAAPKVRVNGLCPGLTMSGTGGPPLDTNMQRLLDQIPMGRPGDPTEVAAAAVYLASDASTFTTGALLMVNGGRPW
jgi:NAD(P)-dependent dehydrogenase (short-subunit alcohol dehydrogenase family)